MRNCTMNEDLLKLFPAVLIGAEGDGDGDGEQDPAGDNDPSGEQDPAGDGDQQQQQDEGKDSGALKALQAERKARAAAEKELKALRKAKADAELSEKSDLEQAQTKLKDAEGRQQTLAAALLARDLNDAIRRAAENQKFIDPDDAIAGVDRTSLTYEQDSDDPTQVTIDAKTVEAAVKALATRKPHFINRGTSDGDPSGSQFGGGGNGGKQTQEQREKALREKYSGISGSM